MALARMFLSESDVGILAACRIRGGGRGLDRKLPRLFQSLDRGAVGNLHVELAGGKIDILFYSFNTQHKLDSLLWALDGHFGGILAGAERGVVGIEDLRLQLTIAVVDGLVVG